jgi:hypothetical protein
METIVDYRKQRKKKEIVQSSFLKTKLLIMFVKNHFVMKANNSQSFIKKRSCSGLVIREGTAKMR